MSDLIQKIPAEILGQILEFAVASPSKFRTTRSDVLNLCLVSKTFNAEATRILYRDFETKNAYNNLITRPIKFLRSLVIKPHLARYVKSINLKYVWYSILEFERKDLHSLRTLKALRLHRQPYFCLTIPCPRANAEVEVANKVTTIFLFVVEQILMRTRNIQRLELDLSRTTFVPGSLEFTWRNLARLARLENYDLPHLRVVHHSSSILETWPAFTNLLLVLGPMAPRLDTLKARGAYGPPSSNHRLLPESILPRVKDLDMTFARLNQTDAAHLISACGGLTGFKWSDSADDASHDGQAALAGVLEGLQSHRRTLETLELRMMTDRAIYPPNIWAIPPAASFVEFERLKHLKIDTWCLPNGTILADVLPPQIETFRLTNMNLNPIYMQMGVHFPQMISPVPHGSMAHPVSELAKVASHFPSLRKVTLYSFVGPSIIKDGMSKEEIDTIRGAFDRHGVAFAYSFGLGLYPTREPGGYVTEQ